MITTMLSTQTIAEIVQKLGVLSLPPSELEGLDPLLGAPFRRPRRGRPQNLVRWTGESAWMPANSVLSTSPAWPLYGINDAPLSES